MEVIDDTSCFDISSITDNPLNDHIDFIISECYAGSCDDETNAFDCRQDDNVALVLPVQGEISKLGSTIRSCNQDIELKQDIFSYPLTTTLDKLEEYLITPNKVVFKDFKHFWDKENYIFHSHCMASKTLILSSDVDADADSLLNVPCISWLKSCDDSDEVKKCPTEGTHVFVKDSPAGPEPTVFVITDATVSKLVFK